MKKKILFIENAPGAGGSCFSLKMLLQELQDNYECYILIHKKSLNLFENENKYSITTFGKHFANAYYIKNKIFRMFYRSLLFFVVLFRTLKLIIKIRPQLVYLNNSIPQNFIELLACKLAGKKVICHLRSLRGLKKLFSKTCIPSQFIAVSNAVKQYYVANGYNSNKIKTIHNYIQINEPINKDSAKITFGFIGRYDYLKGCDIFIEAILKQKDYSNIEFLLYGEGDEEDTLKELIKQNNLTEVVLFKGFQKQTEIFPFIDVVVVPSRLPDSLPRTIMEAFSYGIPVIGSHIGGIPEMIEHGYNGFLYHNNKPEELAKCMKICIEQSGLMQKMKENAYKTAKEKFGYSNFLEIKNIIDNSIKNTFTEK